MQPTLVVLAAGMGSRYGGFKQIEPVGPSGEFVLDYSVYDAWRSGFGKVVFVIRRSFEDAMREHFKAVGERLDLRFVYQEADDLPAGFKLPADREKPWGTGHAIWASRHVVNEPFAVINGDDFYGPGSYPLLADFLRGSWNQPGDYCLAAFELSKTLSKHGTVARGICEVGADGLLRGVTETLNIAAAADGGGVIAAGGEDVLIPGATPVSMNMWGFQPDLYKQLERLFVEFLQRHGSNPKAEYYIPTVVDQLITSGECRAHVLTSSEQWLGMTYRQDLAAVAEGIRQLIGRGIYPHALWQAAAV